MSLIKNKNTKPEMLVRRLVHGMGYRYRLHAKDLPGKPDLVFRSKQKVIFVHGCFWHLHDCNTYRLPKSNSEFWLAKLKGNAERDERNKKILSHMGYRVMEIWSCELKDEAALRERITTFLAN